MISSSGHMAAAGLERSDTDYEMVHNDTVWFSAGGSWSGSAPGATASLAIGTASESREVLVAVWAVCTDTQNVDISGIEIGGVTAENFAATSVNMGTGTESLMVAVASSRVPSGTTTTAKIILDDTSGNGSYQLRLGLFDCGVPAEITTGSDNTAHATTQALDVGDIGDKSSCLAVALFEDQSNDDTAIDWTVSVGRTEDEQGDYTAGSDYSTSWLIANGPPSNDFALSCQPDNPDAGDKGCMAYITAHFN